MQEFSREGRKGNGSPFQNRKRAKKIHHCDGAENSDEEGSAGGERRKWAWLLRREGEKASS